MKRLKRKSGKNRHLGNRGDFQTYLNNLKDTHRLQHDDCTVAKKIDISDERFQQKMIEKWNEHEGDCYLVEVLAGFQASIQSVCENIVLLDRVEFLRERGFECSLRKVTDDAVSPRCYALIASKAQS